MKTEQELDREKNKNKRGKSKSISENEPISFKDWLEECRQTGNLPPETDLIALTSLLDGSKPGKSFLRPSGDF
ncbi:MAG: hypothetical protein HQK96_13470 [Nitrospirae bacterium]|nr:hypothetical protein [Nitrospirota bacterium]